MGASGKWLKSLINLKKASVDDQGQLRDESKSKKKWKLWRSSSEGFGSAKPESLKTNSVASFVNDESFAAAMAAVVRATPKDFKLVKEEWAAIRIQAIFRGFLARRALRALRAVVRIQAIFRGRLVRKQAAVTLRCMQALVRVQARVRARCGNTTPEGQNEQKLRADQWDELDPIKQAERGWCDSPGTVNDVRTKLHNRQKGAIKRERANAYSLTQQRSTRPSSSPYARTNRTVKLSSKHENLSHEFSWLDRWMASKPWENRLMEEITPEKNAPFSRKTEDFSYSSSSSGRDSIEVRRNNITTRISAKLVSENLLRPESLYNESSSGASTSSESLSPSMVFRNTLKMEKSEEIGLRKPSYMNLTESTKSKQIMGLRFSSPCRSSPITLSNGDTRSCVGYNTSSAKLIKDLGPQMSTRRNGSVRSRQP